jgi:sugar lactone lactonase YvrE
MHGVVYGGQKLVKGAAVTLYSVGTGGYGSSPTMLGGTTTTDDAGAWTISFTKPDGDPLVYVVTNGGDIGNGPNGAIALLSALGPLSKVPSAITVNEVTTVVSVYSVAQFLDSSAAAVGAPASNTTGLSNAFGTVPNLVDLASGVALTSQDAFTPILNPATHSSEAPPGPLVNTLAELLSVCIGSTGPQAAGCTSLFTLAKPSAQGPTPTDTRQAILYVALHPANNVPELFAFSRTGSVTFQPDLGNAAPNDFTMAINFVGGALAQTRPIGIAIDAAGNAWVTAETCQCVVELGPQGTPAGPFTSSGTPPLDFNAPGGAISISTNPNTGQQLAWLVSTFGQDVHALDTNSDTFLFGGNGLTAGLITPESVATDALGNVWVANFTPHQNTDGSSFTSVFELSPGPMNDYSDSTEFRLAQLPPPTGAFPPSNFAYIALDGDSPANIWLTDVTENRIVEFRGRTAGVQNNIQSFPLPVTNPANTPGPLAVDANGNVWVVDTGAHELVKSATEFTLSNFPNNTIYQPGGIAIDSAGNVWVSNVDTNGNKGVVELAPDGTLLSVPGGAFNGGSPATGGPLGLSRVANFLVGIAIDSSGNLWIATDELGGVVELVGAASPVKTPNSGPPIRP